MVEKIVYDYLKDELPCDVYMQRPAKLPDKFVLIEKTGSNRQNRIDSATLAVQSCAQSLAEAALLNEEVKTAFDRMMELRKIGGVKLNSDYNYTDTASKQYRYQAVFVVTHY